MADAPDGADTERASVVDGSGFEKAGTGGIEIGDRPVHDRTTAKGVVPVVVVPAEFDPVKDQ